MDKPKKPSTVALEIYRLGHIQSMSTNVDRINMDVIDFVITLRSNLGKEYKARGEDLVKILMFTPNRGSIAQLHPIVAEECLAWDTWYGANVDEIAEYKRLREKYGDEI